MDPGAIVPSSTPLLTGEAMAFSASALAFAAMVVSRVRTYAVRLRGAGTVASCGPLLSGVYRGRSVEMTLAESGTLYVTAHVLNRQGEFAEFGTDDTMAASWVPALCRYRLQAWKGSWSVAVRGQRLLFSCRLPGSDLENMGRALDLTCDLAESLDRRMLAER